MPVVAVLEEWCRPPFSCWKCGDEIFGAHGFGWNSVFRWTTGGSVAHSSLFDETFAMAALRPSYSSGVG
jgi:hypothetical protein